MTILPIRRALLSVSNKNDLLSFAQNLQRLNVEIISTGGTSQILASENIPHQQVETVTGMTEMLDGRVKTLHPSIHGGILGRRDKHDEEAKAQGIQWIDLVIVNFYPFSEAIKNQEISFADAVEYIDIGGPTMVRAAAKNFQWVCVVTDPLDYPLVLSEIETQGGISEATRQSLAQKAFALTSDYDLMINQFFMQQQSAAINTTKIKTLRFKEFSKLRYGENPHQQAFAYQALQHNQRGILDAKIHQGKELSFNNIIDAEAGLTCISEFERPTCVIIKHATPCGIASADQIVDAYEKAKAADPQSAFGGIIAINRSCDEATATAITQTFTEVVIAPHYSESSLSILKNKPNVRVIELAGFSPSDWEMKMIAGGMLMQERDPQVLTEHDLQIVTKTKPNQVQIQAMLFAWRAIKHIKSNAILITKEDATVGIGAGQVSRIDAVEVALFKAGCSAANCILASDAFFPFRDSIDRIAQAQIKAIVQPGGAMRDQEVINACDEHGIAMVFTGKRCFKH